MRLLNALSSVRWRNDLPHVAAVLLPPLAVKLCGRSDQLLMSVLLTLILWVPGVLHALAVVTEHQANDEANRLVAAFRNHVRR